MFSRATASSSTRPKSEVTITNGLSSGAVNKKLQYPRRLTFYDKPPLEEITIEDFEVWAIDRLRGTLLLCKPICTLSAHSTCTSLGRNRVLLRAKQILGGNQTTGRHAP